jgi:hypothetical protein
MGKLAQLIRALSALAARPHHAGRGAPKPDRLSGKQPNLPAIAVSASHFALILIAVLQQKPHRAFAELALSGI